MGSERRKSTRTGVIVNVDIRVLAGANYEGCARDISYGGVCVDIYGDDPPIIGAKAHLDFLIWTGEKNIKRRLVGTVVRSSSASLALMFDAEPELATKTVDEILHYQQFERRRMPRKQTK